VVRLPILVEFVPPQAAPTTTGIALAAVRLRILVVDDNQDSTKSLAKLLELDGHETMTAHDGLEAVQAAEAFRPDLVLLDIGLPKINGFEACRRIRKQSWGSQMVLVAPD
jgi:CheY-like chemotaxis protein